MFKNKPNQTENEEMNGPKGITSLRQDLFKQMDKPGVTPVLRDGKFIGLVVSTGELDESTTQRILKRLQANQPAGINEVTGIALANSDANAE